MNSDLFDVVGGGTPSKSHPEYWDGDIPWVSPKDMKCDVVSETQDHITAEAIENSATRLIPAGSLLIVYRSGILAHSFPIAFAGREVTINQDLKALSAKGEVTNEFLYGLFSAVPEYGLACVKKGATVHNVDGRRFVGLDIPIPPVPMQHHRAFTGELTANWREAHREELEAEVQAQTKALADPAPRSSGQGGGCLSRYPSAVNPCFRFSAVSAGAELRANCPKKGACAGQACCKTVVGWDLSGMLDPMLCQHIRVLGCLRHGNRFRRPKSGNLP